MMACGCGRKPNTDPPITSAQLEQQQREQRGMATPDSAQNAINNANSR